MGDTSDGDKTNDQIRNTFREERMKKTRSFSAGSVKLSTKEINTIIGISKVDDRSKIRADKENNKQATNKMTITDKQPNIRGTGDKSEQENSNVNTQGIDERNGKTEDSLDNPFKPTKSVVHTPPSKNNNPPEINRNSYKTDISTKRIRSDNTPEQENKRQCSEMQVINKENKNDGKEEERRQNADINLEGVISQVFTSLDGIQKVETKMGQLLTREDCDTLRNASSETYKCLTLLIHRIGQLEKKIMLQEIEKSKQINEQENQQHNTIKTYAATVKATTEKQSMENQINSEKNVTWTTPKTRKNLELLVSINNESNSRHALQTLKQHISLETVGSLKNVKHLKTGALVLESHDEEQQKKLKNVLGGKTNVLMREQINMDPMFMVTGISKGIEDQDFLEDIVRLNDEIETELGYSIKSKIKVITKKQCRNQFKENWILQAPPDISKCFLKRQTINFDLVKVHVQEHFNLAMCFNCSGFGHVAKHCKDKQCCHKCGGEHRSKDCTTESLRCPNCIKMKYDQDLCHHSARDNKCPVFIRRLNQYQGQINYTSSNKSFL